MEQIAGIEPVLPAWEAEVLTIERYLHYGALDGIRTHTPKALPSEDSVSTCSTTRALSGAPEEIRTLTQLSISF